MPAERIHVYELTEVLPRGGPGRVHRGRVAESGGPLARGTPVVVRVVSVDDVEDERILGRLVEVHTAARRIEHPRVVAPVDHGLSTGAGGRCFWSVSPYAEARPLSEVMGSVDYVPDVLTESFLKHAAEAIAAAHASGVHGLGLSPASILLLSDGSAALADPAFGPAVGPRWPAMGRPPAAMMCAAPAVLDGVSCDPRDDLFALGAILFRCMTGAWHRPEDARALLVHSGEMEAQRPNDLRPKCSLFLSEVAWALTRPQRDDRIPSADELVSILTQRRRSAWWHGLHIDQDTHDDEPATRRPAAQEPAPPPIPEPAASPDEDWWSQRGLTSAPTAPHPSRCVGRDAEIALLLDAALRLPDQGGHAVLLTGASGSGKTRVIDAFVERLRELPAHRAPIVLRGEHRRTGVGRPLGGFTEALTQWVHGHRLLEPHELAPLLGESAGIAASFAAVLSSEAAPVGVPPLARESLAPSYLRCIRTITGRSPVVLIVENLQWADPEVHDLFVFLARAGSDLPVLLVGTFRPDERQDALAEFAAGVRTSPRAREIRLADLDPQHIAQIAREFVSPAAIAGEIAARVVSASGGSPGALVEAVRALEAEGALVRAADGRYGAQDSLATTPVPTTAADAARRRLAALDAPSRAFLSAAIVQGVAFDAEVARIAAGIDARTAARVLDDLARRAVLLGDGVARRFESHVLYDAVSESLDDAARCARHEASASAFLATRNPDQLPPSRIHGILSYRVAWHYMLSGRGARGLLYVNAAVEHLRATFRHGDGERLTALACRTIAADPTRGADLVDMLLERARFLGAQGRAADQSETLDEALLRTRERRDLMRESRILFELAKARRASGDAATADSDAKQALACAHRAGELDVELRVHVWLGQTAYRESRWQDARSHYGEALEIARRRSDGHAEAEIRQGLGLVAQATGAFDQAEEAFQLALTSHRARADLVREAEVLSCLGNLAAASGDPVRAEGCLRRALAIYVSLGDGAGETRALGMLAMILQDGGCLVEALEAHRTCLDRARRLDSRGGEIVALLNLATVDAALGRLDDARDAYGEALRHAQSISDERLQGYALTGLAEIARQHGDDAVARGLLGRAAAQFRATQDPSGLAAALLALGRVETYFGDAATAASLLSEARRLAEQQNAQQVSVVADSLLALIAARSGDRADAERRLAESGLAASDLRPTDTTYLETHFLHSLVLRVLGHHDEADRRVRIAESSLLELTRGLADADRDRILSDVSPYREIVACADAARARAPVHAPSNEETVAV